MSKPLIGRGCLAFIFLAAILGGLATAVFLLLWPGERMMAEIKERGEPINLYELRQWVGEVPPYDNAANLYLDAAKVVAYENDPEKREQIIKTIEEDSTVSADALQFLQSHVDANRPAYALMEQAAELPEAQYPVPLTPGEGLPYLARSRELARLLRDKALLASIEGNQGEALRTVGQMVALTDSLESSPLLISQLVRLALVSITVSTLDAVLEMPGAPNEDLRALQAQFSQIDIPAGVRMGYIGERAFGLEAAPHFLGRSTYLRGSQMLIETAGKPYHEISEELIALEEKAQQGGLLALMDFGRLTIPALARGRMAFARGMDELQLAQTALALEQFRNDTGDYPDSLLELEPDYLQEVPVSDVTGDLILYERIQGGYRLTNALAEPGMRPEEEKIRGKTFDVIR